MWPWVRTPHGAVLRLDPRDKRSRSLVLRRGQVDARVTRACIQLCRELSPAAFVDVGANYGEVALEVLLATRTQVICVEPNPAVAACLEWSLRRAAARGDGAGRLWSAAVSDRSGIVQLATDTGSSGSVRTVPTGAGLNGGLWVPAVTLDRIVRESGLLSRPVVVKIDVEGEERRVLAAGLESLSVKGSAAVVESHKLGDADISWIQRWFQIVSLAGYEPLDRSIDIRRPPGGGKDVLLLPRSHADTTLALLQRHHDSSA